jgi:hypothetical protein
MYDPRAIEIVKESLASGSPRAAVYALEIMDLLLVPWLKPLVFPVLEDQTPGQTLKRLEAFVPRQRMSPIEVLGAVVNREFDRIGLFTRVVAIETLGKVAPGVARDLVAGLFHPEPMVQEVAAIGIVSRDRAVYEDHRKRLPFEVRDRLDAVVGRDGEPDLAESRSVFGRARMLRSVPDFGALPSETLVALAVSSEERLLKEGQRLPNPREPRESFHVLLAGNLTAPGSEPGEEDVRLERMSLFGILPGARSVEAVEPCRLVRIEPTRLFELAGENMGLIPGLLRACRLLSVDATLA